MAVVMVWMAAARDAVCAPDPASMDARTAYLTGVDLTRTRRNAESLPYFHRALGLRPDLWQVHSDYGAALINSVSEARSVLGTAIGVTRSSWERVAMIQEGLLELDRAERLAATPLDSALIIATRAQVLAIWGLSWNGLVEYGRARRLDAASAELRRRTELLRSIMREP